MWTTFYSKKMVYLCLKLSIKNLLIQMSLSLMGLSLIKVQQRLIRWARDHM